jgi:uncharacterized protein
LIVLEISLNFESYFQNRYFDMVGRNQERVILDELFASKKPELLVVYGRRRIGKTYLIRQHFTNRIAFDFVGSNNESNQVQIANFNRAFREQCTDKYKDAEDWSDAFNNLAKFLRTLPKSKKAVVFMDEFPWLDKPQSNFLGAFEYFWNQHASSMSHLLFVACGSVASWVIKNLINDYGGLHNRVTKTLELKPFSLNETEQLLLSKSLKFTRYQIAQLYMAVGGVPYYIDLITKSSSVNQAIDRLFFLNNSPLSKEFVGLFASLYKKPEPYIAVIKTLAGHHYGLDRQQLLHKTKIAPGGSFNRVMTNLEECGFIIRIQPYGKKNRESIFRLIDMFSIFYLRFVENNKSNRLGAWQSFADTASFKTWSGYAFENISFLHLPQIHTALGISGLHTEVSSWKVEKNPETGGAQIDLVVDRKDGIIHLCEAKFTNKPLLISDKLAKDLGMKRSIFEYFCNSRKAIVTTIVTTYPTVQNKHYKDEVHSEILLDDLFNH